MNGEKFWWILELIRQIFYLYIMPNQITGRLVYIGQPQEIPSKSGGNPFVKREFILDATTYDPIQVNEASTRTFYLLK